MKMRRLDNHGNRLQKQTSNHRNIDPHRGKTICLTRRRRHSIAFVDKRFTLRKIILIRQLGDARLQRTFDSVTGQVIGTVGQALVQAPSLPQVVFRPVPESPFGSSRML
jgi:hypothetical protein